MSPSPLWGEGWGVGVRPPRILSNARHPHPTLPLEGEGSKIPGNSQVTSNVLEHTVEVLHHAVVPVADDLVTVRLDDPCALFIRSCRFSMLAAIQLDDELCGSTGEVG